MSEASYTAEECFNGMLDADKALYEKCLDTPGFALWWNRLGMRARAADAALAACEAALSVMRSPEYGGAPGTTRAVSDLVAALALAKPNQQGGDDGP